MQPLAEKKSSVPSHVAIVMDGNGRWAKARGHARFFGHVRGVERVREIVRTASKDGVGALTLFAFSTENWSRPAMELQVLWKLLARYLRRELKELDENGVRLRFFGQRDRLSPELRELTIEAERKLAHNKGLQLNLALSYGSRTEIADAARNLACDCQSGKVKPELIDETTFQSYLWTAALGDLSDVDLVIRTSGEKRTSNFLLWQAAYAEYVYLDTCWPDFTPAVWKKALQEFAARERRFGKVL